MHRRPPRHLVTLCLPDARKVTLSGFTLDPVARTVSGHERDGRERTFHLDDVAHLHLDVAHLHLVSDRDGRRRVSCSPPRPRAPRCVCCSGRVSLQRVRVEPRRPEAVAPAGTVSLCPRCREAEDASWRLRWVEVEA
jgi:hypothetical protein